MSANNHPLFYQSGTPLPVIDHAKGVHMWDTNGKEYIDGCSGSMICNIGHGDERVMKTMAEQGAKASFAYRTQFDNTPSLELALELVRLTPENLDRVYYVSGGSEAVESAMKLCRQYLYVTGQAGRTQFVARRPSYHGATMGALALTSYKPLEVPFRCMMQAYPKIPAPYCYRCAYGESYPDCGLKCAKELEKVFLEYGPEAMAAFVVEPVGGASVGALDPPDGYFDVIQDICRRHGVMLILDEVMTGFGRTGKLFALEHWNIKPDIMAISKGMASGYFPLGGVMCEARITDAVLKGGGFAHGHTYAGNPMACAVGRTVLDIIVKDKLPENAAVQGEALKGGMQALADKYEMIGQVRGKGLLLAMELVADRKTRAPFPREYNVANRLTKLAYELGLLIYPRHPIDGVAGDHVLLSPPLIVTKDEVAEILSRLDKACAAMTKELKAKGF